MRFAVRALVLCAIALMTAASAPPSLAQVLEHMREFNGGLFAAHITSTSPHVVDGSETVLDTDVQGFRFSLRECTGDVCLGTYFDGEHLYSVNINGTKLPSSPEPQPYLRALRILGTLQFLAPDFTNEGGKIADGGYVLFEGRACRRLYVSDPIATPMIVYVDPQTWLVAGARDVNGNATYVMRDYHRVGLYQLPFEIDRNGMPLERYVTRKVAQSPLNEPAGLMPQVSATPAGMPIDPESTTPLGTCTIAGARVGCLIDTGNSALSMSVELADSLGLKPLGMLQVKGLGNYATEVVHAGPLQLGNVRFPEANYIVLSDIHRYGYDLVLGADVLANMPVTIDYARHALFFGGDTEADRDGTTVPLHFQNFVPVVNVTLGDLPTSLAVDTGDQSNINLAYDYYRQHSSLFQATSSADVSGIGGRSVEMIGHIPSVRIGTLTAENQQIGTTQTLKGTADGHLGAGFLSKYRVVLDYAHARLELVPKKPLPHK
jgi:hypothetical protein